MAKTQNPYLNFARDFIRSMAIESGNANMFANLSSVSLIEGFNRVSTRSKISLIKSMIDYYDDQIGNFASAKAFKYAINHLLSFPILSDSNMLISLENVPYLANVNNEQELTSEEKLLLWDSDEFNYFIENIALVHDLEEAIFIVSIAVTTQAQGCNTHSAKHLYIKAKVKINNYMDDLIRVIGNIESELEHCHNCAFDSDFMLFRTETFNIMGAINKQAEISAKGTIKAFNAFIRSKAHTLIANDKANCSSIYASIAKRV